MIKYSTTKYLLFLSVAFLLNKQLFAQSSTKSNAVTDTTFNYDELFSALDDFFDSLYTPHSFVMVSSGVSNVYYNYTSASRSSINSIQQLTFSPSIGYFHKNGLGVSAASSVLYNNVILNPYQLSASGFYDYLKKRRFATGVSFTHIFIKDSLPFYTSPLNNEVAAYFTYRKWWIKPMLSANYGWGSRTSFSQSKEYVKLLKKKKKNHGNGNGNNNNNGNSSTGTVTTTSTTQEDINDFSITASIKHDFYWLDILGKKSFVRLTPQLTFTSGTQKFGFNEISNTYTSSKKTNIDILHSSRSMYLDNKVKFQPLAINAFLKSEFSIGKYFLQPQVILNYYIPESDDKFTMLFSLNTGFIL